MLYKILSGFMLQLAFLTWRIWIWCWQVWFISALHYSLALVCVNISFTQPSTDGHLCFPFFTILWFPVLHLPYTHLSEQKLVFLGSRPLIFHFNRYFQNDCRVVSDTGPIPVNNCPHLLQHAILSELRHFAYSSE